MRNYSSVNDDFDDIEDKTPYSSLSDRDPIDDVTGLADSQKMMAEEGYSIPGQTMQNPMQAPMSQSDQVKRMVAGRMSHPMGAPRPQLDYNNDPLMKSFDQQEQRIGDLRQAQHQSNLISNLAQALSPITHGGSQIADNSALNQNIQRQNASDLSSSENELHRRQQVINSIENRNARSDAQKNALEMRKMFFNSQQAARDAATKQKNDRQSSMNVSRANSLVSGPMFNKEITKMNSARSAQTLIDSIKSGELKGSKNVRNQLTNLMAQIELGGGGSEGDRHAMGVDNFYTRAKDAVAFLDSHPNDSIPPSYLDQLGQEAHALGDRAAQNYKILGEAALSGADLSGGDPNLDAGQIHKLAKQHVDTFLKKNGYSPETGQRVQSKETAFPKQVRKDGHMATVNSPEELREAMAEGWN